MVLITITMFFGGGLIPWFLLMKDIGLYNNLWAMILPTALSTWNIIILRTGFQSIPRELEEAALIDGASQANILITVILPLSKPRWPLSSCIIWSGIGTPGLTRWSC